ncbi:NAD-binding protein [Nocardioides sp. TRM66260-LWL]|uniref:CASTOR/POLLUX-related putative ion channel n=1 Tax=Nocardioides sp. TRM66260-LWL TaxID=2874478 RepID=UPI001CC38E25|nr:NAD-binding protein [Nocardioides sp. TRM66260-LWL]MBZ5734186.1 NAD-binding protein [Nocardioides sp. TRM66260-LWL]
MGQTGRQMRQRTTAAMAERGTGSSSVKAAQQIAPTVRWSDRARYLFDNSMSRGTPALIAWLSVVTLVLILLFGTITALLGLRDGGSEGYGHEVFSALMHALDPGTVAGDTGSWRFLLTMLALTIAGLFIVSALIGVIAAGIDAKIAELQRGRSLVLERDHTVILGWSDSIFTILRELSIANESRRRPVIVVLADKDKVEMEEEIRAKVPDLRGTRVVCRSGSPMDVDELAVASHRTARSVILLAPASEDPDAEVIKTLLALTHDGGDGPRIVAEIRNPTNLEAARLVGADRTTLLDIRETVAKLVVQTSRQSGASAVYTELFDYDGDEIYFLAEHPLAELTYAQAQHRFEAASLIGLIGPDGVSTLNPAPDTVVGASTLILVAEDDDVLDAAGRALAEPVEEHLGETTASDDHPGRAVMIGWNERAPLMLAELDRYATPGSTLTVLTTHGVPVVPPLETLQVEVVRGSTTDRATLEQHVVGGLDQVIVLCYSDDLEPQAADARTLVTLLHVRDVLGRLGADTAVVSEMMDDRNRVLAQVASIDDVVVSGEIVSLIVTQLSEDGRLEAVFSELLGADGAEIYLRPAEWYVRPGVEVSWASVVEGAIRRGETAIGWKSDSLADAGTEFGVQVNPAKSTSLTVQPGDRIVVLAND